MIDLRGDTVTKQILILPPRYSVDSIALYQAAAAIENWKVERLQGWRIPENFNKDRNFAIYGESLFGAVVSEQLNLSLIEPHFEWLANLPQKFTLREIHSVTFKEAKEHNIKSFFKPADDKCFPAKVYDSGSQLNEFTSLSENTPVIISEPVKWNAEFRFFVADGIVETFSPYSRNGELIQNEQGQWLATSEENQNAIELCQNLIAEYSENIPPAVVIDIGEIEGRGWAVVEANPCWASGIYGCEPVKVLKVLKRACLKSKNISECDSQWILERND
jgi:ATP-grasp domain, R2K clade family 2